MQSKTPAKNRPHSTVSSHDYVPVRTAEPSFASNSAGQYCFPGRPGHSTGRTGRRELGDIALVRRVTSAPTAAVAAPVAAARLVTTAATRGAVSTVVASATGRTASTAPATAAARHSRNVGALGYDLDVAAFKNTVVEYQCLSDKTRFHELDVRIAIALYQSTARSM